MHHKRKKASTRREVRRYQNKSYRMSEAQLLDGGRANTLAWDHKKIPLPLPDAPSNGTKFSKRERPKKERCPNNGTHEWYKEWITERDYYIAPGFCFECDRLGIERAYRWMGCHLHGEKVYYTTRIYKATCIHCWKIKNLKVESDRWSSYRNRRRKLVLPKRQVRF